MSEEEKEKIVVRDKRRFSAETGELREDAPPAPEAPKAVSEPPKTEPEAPKSDPSAEKKSGPIPEASFSGMVMNFASQAMAFMGAVPEAQIKMDLSIAKHLIETLEVIQVKTKGNLTKEEDELLTNGLYQLHMMFVESTKKKE